MIRGKLGKCREIFLNKAEDNFCEEASFREEASFDRETLLSRRQI